MMNPLLMPLAHAFSRRSSLSSPGASAELPTNGIQHQMHRIRMVSLEESCSFEPIERDLRPGTVLELGRFTDDLFIPNRISFRSKVVSRRHAVIWVENGKILLKDTKSSSGTFLNHVRMSASGRESRAQTVKDGDIIQLGINYKGGIQEIYRCVRMRLEIDREKPLQVSKFSQDAYQNLQRLVAWKNAHDTSKTACNIPECCICLYALAPKQAFLIAPCQHAFHYKCARSLLDHYPKFLCPLCRSYADLEADYDNRQDRGK